MCVLWPLLIEMDSWSLCGEEYPAGQGREQGGGKVMMREELVLAFRLREAMDEDAWELGNLAQLLTCARSLTVPLFSSV